MKGKMVFGALMLSVALCSQGMALDLLDNMSGLNAGGCNACVAPAPCAAVKACAPEPVCGPCAPRCDLFAGLKDLFACRRCEPCGPCTECKTCAPEPAPCAAVCGGCGDCVQCRPVRNLVRNVVVEPLHDLKCDLKAAFARPCAPCGACAPVCEAPKACVQACEAPKACAPVCKPCRVAVCKPVCEAPKACAPACNDCGKCFRCRPVLTFIDNLFSALKPCRSCNVACGEVSGCGCGATVVPGAPAPVPAAAPAPVAAPQEAAPLPAAPKADPSASLMRSRSIYQATASIVQN